MRRCAYLIVEECIEAELAAALRQCPPFRGGHELPANVLAPELGIDVPAFEVRNSIGNAVLSIRTDRQLSEADSVSGIVDRQQDFESMFNLPAKNS